MIPEEEKRRKSPPSQNSELQSSRAIVMTLLRLRPLVHATVNVPKLERFDNTEIGSCQNTILHRVVSTKMYYV
jgi:hypothetical protein